MNKKKIKKMAFDYVDGFESYQKKSQKVIEQFDKQPRGTESSLRLLVDLAKEQHIFMMEMYDLVKPIMLEIINDGDAAPGERK